MDTKFFMEQTAGATVVFAVAALVAWLLRSHTAASRHLTWWLATIAALLLPIASSWKPAGAPQIILTPPPTNTVNIATVANQARSWTSAEVITAAWFVGCALVSARLILALVRVYLRRRSSTLSKITVDNPAISVRLSDRISVPETFGFLRPVVLLPVEASEWSQERLQVVLAHELVHIERRDWLTQMIAQVTACLYWFHPLAWLALAQMRREGELACDDGVLRLGYRSSEYARHLVEIASGIRCHAEALSTSVAMATRSQLETRIRAILNPKMNRGNVTTMMKIAAISCTAIAVVLFSGSSSAATTSRISGTIGDISGAVIPNATVVLSRITPPKSTVATASSNAGDWSFASVEAGDYNLEVKTPGFRPYLQRVTVTAGAPMSFGIRLDVGSIQDTITVQGETSSRLNRAGGSPQRIRVGGNVRPTQLIKKVDPDYPQHLKDAGISGTVILQAVIGVEGDVLNVRPISPDVNQELINSAVNAVKQWKYAPTLLNGVSIEVSTMITVNFALAHRE
ncbi:MAG TPA: M56 family metallopeptidase [Bryobacteraceae bacterium]|nr:M56 family metallopeptidase [Bryobacteraceae bacterium]